MNHTQLIPNEMAYTKTSHKYIKNWKLVQSTTITHNNYTKY